MPAPYRNSTEARVQTFDDARLAPPALPAHLSLTPEQLPFWDAVVDALPRSAWSEQRLTLAWQVACVQADIQSKRRSLERSPFRAALGRWHVDQRRVDLPRLIALQLRLLRALKIIKAAPRGKPPTAPRTLDEILLGDD